MWNFRSNSFVLTQMRRERGTFVTVYFLGTVLVGFFLCYFAFGRASEPETPDTLLQLHIIFRHGDRTPTSSYPNDPHKGHIWPEGAGALTNKGKRQMYKLGQTLRKRYNSFLTDMYNESALVVMSSYAARCQMSAMTLLAGLYPPKGGQVWNDDLLWQPIPVNPIPRESDNLLAAKADCQAFTVEKNESDSRLNKELRQSKSDLLKYLSEHIGAEVDSYEYAERIYGVLKAQTDNGLSAPDWAHSVFPAPLDSLAATNLASYTGTEKLKKFQSGPLIEKILRRLQSQSQSTFLYSAHDLTIVNLLRGLGFVEDLLPEYGASVAIELHTGNKPTVKILYFKSSEERDPTPMFLPVCDHDCSLDDFTVVLKPVVPDDWAKECSL